MWFVVGGLALLALVAVLSARKNRGGGSARHQVRDHGDHAEAHLYTNIHRHQGGTMGPF